MAKRSHGLGLISAGNIGRSGLNVLRNLLNLNMAAACDQDVDRAATAAECGMTPYSNFDELLADKAADIVAINTPPPSHAALSMAVLDSGKHVFCENCW